MARSTVGGRIGAGAIDRCVKENFSMAKFCYLDFDELRSISVVLRLLQRCAVLSLAQGVAFAITHFCCLTRASICNR